MEKKKANWKPEGYHSLTPYLSVSDAEKAIEFYKEAFGAEEISRLPGPGGAGVMHAELKIGDSMFMLGQGTQESSHEHRGGHESSHGEHQHSENISCMVHVYVEDVDKAFERAQAAGATVKMPVEDMFWGDRYGTLVDPFGHHWGMATHIEDLTLDQIRERAEEFFAKAGGSC